MDNAKIEADIKSQMTMAECAEKIGLTRQGLFNKIHGVHPWKVTDLLELSRVIGWTVEEFLEVIGWKGENK